MNFKRFLYSAIYQNKVDILRNISYYVDKTVSFYDAG